MGFGGNVRKLIKILMRAPSTSVIYSIDFDLIADTADNGRKAAFRWRGEITYCTTHPQAPTLGSAAGLEQVRRCRDPSPVGAARRVVESPGPWVLTNQQP